jgi:Fe-S cluster biogenesis protein NfuA
MCDKCGCGDHKETELTLEEKVKDLIDAIRPNLQSHGGDIEFISMEKDNTVKVRLQGACSGCPGARMTLKNGVERLLKEQVPEVKEVVAVD